MMRSIDIKQLLKNNIEEKRVDVFSVDMQREILKRLGNAEKEKERIIKELQSEELDNLIKKNRRDGFGDLELYAGMPEYHYREGFSDGIGIAINIVKRGGTGGSNEV